MLRSGVLRCVVLRRLTALTGLCCLLLVPLTSQPGAAAWTSRGAATTGALRTAGMASTFVVVQGGGTGGATYRAVKVLGATTVGVVDLHNGSTAPAVLMGAVSLDNFLISTTVAVESCSLPWVGAACNGTRTTALPATAISGSRPLRWHPGSLPVGGVVHLRLTVGGSLANVLTAAVDIKPGRAAMDRTWA